MEMGGPMNAYIEMDLLDSARPSRFSGPGQVTFRGNSMSLYLTGFRWNGTYNITLSRQGERFITPPFQEVWAELGFESSDSLTGIWKEGGREYSVTISLLGDEEEV